MSVDNFKYQASPKDEDILVNVRGESAEEFEHNLLNFPHAAYAQFKASFRGGAALGTIVAPNQQQVAQPVVQQQAAAPSWAAAQPSTPSGPVNGTPHPEGKLCTCGAGLAFKSVKNGQFKMWVCPNQKTKGDGHLVEWID